MQNCELCQFYDYDQENDLYFCSAEMDEDDYARYLERRNRDCPFFRPSDDYATARRQ